ncbi:hypothetical protein N658DRAFT_126975 [Parathielavia hyrcaniae]|uniref:Uncharacterized protein n=1 Tax=Parathielavia hyrcaniae TaxID=113614 RepID=A0AAN6QBD4_9PEZI|nr:hypothetical protein N658DRAFT_126975 [Parathielavia hyrcaniae]
MALARLTRRVEDRGEHPSGIDIHLSHPTITKMAACSLEASGSWLRRRTATATPAPPATHLATQTKPAPTTSPPLQGQAQPPVEFGPRVWQTASNLTLSASTCSISQLDGEKGQKKGQVSSFGLAAASPLPTRDTNGGL